MRSVYSVIVTMVRFSSWAAPAALVALVVVLAGLGLGDGREAIALVIGIVVAFGPSGWLGPSGWRRRAAEAILLVAAAGLIFIPSEAMRQMAVGPILVAAAWAAWSACIRRAPGSGWRLLATGAFGVATVIFAHPPPTTEGIVAGAGAVLLAAALPSAMALFSTAAGPIGVGASLIMALAAGPAAVWITALVCIVVIVAALPFSDGRVFSVMDRKSRCLRGWYPAVGAVLLLSAALAPWGGLAPGEVLPSLSWVGFIFIAGLLLVALRLPPATAGACTVLVCLLLGPPLAPTPEGGGVDLSGKRPALLMRGGDGGSYSIDVEVRDLDRFRDGARIATVTSGNTRLPLRVRREPEGRMALEMFGSPSVADHSGIPVWRAAGGSKPVWRRSIRYLFEVDSGVIPEFRLAENLADRLKVRIEATGPNRPTPPRKLPGEQWLWLAAAAVALVQLVSGANRIPSSWLPWLVVAFGLVVSRTAVEPLHLAFARHGIDLALAAFLSAWLPAAAQWLRRGRVFRSAATLLVPLALATVQLTPPLWGDEPFHLGLMESIVADHDLDVGNNIVGGGAVGEVIASSHRLFHSPALAAILLPGFAAAGRSGAVFLLALIGAAVIALSTRRLVSLSNPPGRAVVVTGVMVCLTYPLATFSSQVWPGIVGAACLAGVLILVAGRRRDRVGAVLAALVATAVKTRMALFVFPAAAIGWWREDPRARRFGLALIGLAAAAGLVFGWVTMGHPFGFYRRFHHLVPTDPGLAARVIGGLLFDCAGGLAWSAPLWLVALPAMALVWRRGGPGEQAAIVGAAATVAALLHSSEWYGGGSPPARYLVPALPLIVLALGFLVVRADSRRRLLMMIWPAAVAPWWVLVTRPHYSINPGDGRWWLTNSLARRFSADARALFPSFLTPSAATVIVPTVIVILAILLWRVMRRPATARALARLGPALWLALAVGLVATLGMRADTVVEAESAQVRRHGGEPVPPAGTPARATHRDGWKLGDGDTLTFPLNVRQSTGVRLEAEIVRPGWGGSILASWDGGTPEKVVVRRAHPSRPLVVSVPFDGGRHWLQLGWKGRNGAEIFIDRVVMEGD